MLWLHLKLSLCFSLLGNERKKCFYWIVNLLVPAWNLRFNWTWSCSEIRKREKERRERERGRGRGDVPLRTVVKDHQHQWPTLSYSCGETTWPLHGSSAGRLWTLLMWCKNCRVSVILWLRWLKDKTLSPPALLHTSIVLIQCLGRVPIWSLSAFSTQDAHTLMLTYTPSHRPTHI